MLLMWWIQIWMVNVLLKPTVALLAMALTMIGKNAATIVQHPTSRIGPLQP